jgi:hypothetical protein
LENDIRQVEIDCQYREEQIAELDEKFNQLG